MPFSQLMLMPHVVASVMVYYGNSANIKKVLQDQHEIYKLYRDYDLLNEASKPYGGIFTTLRLNMLKYIDSPLYYHFRLKHVHYPNVVRASDYNGDMDIPYDALPNLRELKLDREVPAVIPPNIKKLELNAWLPIPRNHSIEHFHVSMRHVCGVYDNAGSVRAGDMFGPHIKYLEVEGASPKRVRWEGIEYEDQFIRAGPITPTTIIYYDEKDDDLPPLEIDEHLLLGTSRKYRNGNIDCWLDIKRLKKDGTFIPSITFGNDAITVDYSRVESATITYIHIGVVGVDTLRVVMPRDCTNLNSFSAVNDDADIEVTHDDPVYYNGLKYPFLEYCIANFVPFEP